MSNLAVDTVNQEFAAAPGSADGTLVGRNTTTPVGFFGTVPIAQPTIPASGATAAQIATALIALGLCKGV